MLFKFTSSVLMKPLKAWSLSSDIWFLESCSSTLLFKELKAPVVRWLMELLWMRSTWRLVRPLKEWTSISEILLWLSVMKEQLIRGRKMSLDRKMMELLCSRRCCRLASPAAWRYGYCADSASCTDPGAGIPRHAGGTAGCGSGRVPAGW